VAHVLDTTLFEPLLHTYGFETVTLASCNSYSYNKRQVTLRAYMEEHMQPQEPAARANETWCVLPPPPRRPLVCM